MRNPNWIDYFNIDNALMERVISVALSRGGDYADLYFEHKVSSNISYEEHQVKSATRGIASGVGIRVIHDDQIGFAYSDDLSPSAMIHAANTAACIAQSSKNVPAINATPKAFPHLYSISEYSINSDLNKKLALLERANQAGHDLDSRVSKIKILFSDEVRYLQFISSEGIFWQDIQPMLMFHITAIVEDGKHRQIATLGDGGRYGLEFFNKVSPEYIATNAVKQALVLLNAKEAPSGPQEVVLGPADSGILLHEAVGHGLEADFNRKGLSNYSNRVGEKVASSFCTIVDTGHIENQRGSINIDDEGCLPHETILIEGGILRGYLHDKISAKMMNVQPTGNGRRESYTCVPFPRMTNTYMLPGDSEEQEIIQSVKHGIYAKRFGGGQVDISKGDFVFSVVESYLIENGKITEPLKNVTLIGNGPDIMTKVSMVGNDLQQSGGMWTCGKNGQRVPVGVGTPTIKISEMIVGGTAH